MTNTVVVRGFGEQQRLTKEYSARAFASAWKANGGFMHICYV